MHTRLMGFINKHDIIFKHQYGFQKGKLTEHAIFDLYFNIITANEKQEKSASIFRDFAKAFDIANHEILLYKLDYYGVRGIALEWFRSYLSHRQQAVKIGHCFSDFETISRGVPQGSVLGPLLLLLYVNDLHISSPKVKLLLFADDTCLFHSSKNINILQNDLNDLANWLKANKLTLNIDKSSLT